MILLTSDQLPYSELNLGITQQCQTKHLHMCTYIQFPKTAQLYVS